ncbi:MAG: cation:proton antiporter, partial [Candidatus Nanoarchaeia archaeon]
IIVSRLRIPGMVGLIAAGAIIGPHVAKILHRDASINLLGTIGLLFIMFISGVEIDLNQFKKNRHDSLVFGSFTFWIPLLFGIGMGRFMMGYTWPVSILLGSIFSSHTLIPYPIVSRLGLSKTRAVVASVGGTLYTCLLAILILAVVAASVTENLGLIYWIRLIFLVSLYFFLTLWLTPIIGRWFLRKVADNGEVEFVFILASLFVCSFFSLLVGLEPIIGAFLAGIALNRLVPEGSTLMNRIHFVGNALFIPFFLISTGMLIDFNTFARPDAWAVTFAMLAIIFISKWLSAYLSAKVLGFTHDEAEMLFGLSVNQAASTLAAVIVGHRLGLFNDAVLTGAIIMIAVTCLFGTWFTEIFARRVAIKLENSPQSEVSNQNERIMVSIANPENSERLVELAMLARGKNSKDPFYTLSVIQDCEDSDATVLKHEKLLANASSRAIAAGIPVIPITRLETNIADGILSAMKDFRISFMITGWSGISHGLGGTFGNIIDEVVLKSSISLLICRLKSTLSATKNTIFAVPQGAEKHPGFRSSVQSVKRIASQLGSPIMVFSGEVNQEVEKIIRETKPEVPLFFAGSVQRWRRLPEHLKGILTESDLLIVLSQRSNEILWHPVMDNLPNIIAEKFPSSNIVVIYSPLIGNMVAESEKNIPTKVSYSTLFLPERIIFCDSGSTLLNAFSKLFGMDTTISPLWDFISEDIKKMFSEEPLKLTERIYLYHTHLKEIKEQKIFILFNRSNFYTAGGKDFNFAIILLSPKNAPPELHLRTLSQMVKSIKVNEGELLNCKTPQALAELLNNQVAEKS